MVEHVWTVLCAKSVIDQETNNISLMEIIEQVTAHGPSITEGETGVIPINSHLVSLWTRSLDNEPCRAEARIQFIDPSGEILIDRPYEVDLTTHERLRTRSTVPGLKFKQLGRHHFVVQLRGTDDWVQVARIPLSISVRTEDPIT